MYLRCRLGHCFALFLTCAALALLCASGAALAACGSDPPLPPEGLAWPAGGAVIRSWSLDCASDAGHRGIDIAMTAGAAIRSTAPGTVSFAGYTPAEGGGMTVAIVHAGGLRSTYLHLQSLSVSEGARVEAGETIGTSDGAPLHFGLKLDDAGGTYFNPLEFLPAPAAATAIAAEDTPAAASGQPVTAPLTAPATVEQVPSGTALPVPRPVSLDVPAGKGIAAAHAPSTVLPLSLPSSPLPLTGNMPAAVSGAAVHAADPRVGAAHGTAVAGARLPGALPMVSVSVAGPQEATADGGHYPGGSAHDITTQEAAVGPGGSAAGRQISGRPSAVQLAPALGAVLLLAVLLPAWIVHAAGAAPSPAAQGRGQPLVEAEAG